MNRRHCLRVAAAAMASALPIRLAADEAALPEACRSAAAFNQPLPAPRPRVAVAAPFTLRATEQGESMRYVAGARADPDDAGALGGH